MQRLSLCSDAALKATSDSGPAEPVQTESMRDSISDNIEQPELQNTVASWEFSRTSFCIDITKLSSKVYDNSRSPAEQRLTKSNKNNKGLLPNVALSLLRSPHFGECNAA